MADHIAVPKSRQRRPSSDRALAGGVARDLLELISSGEFPPCSQLPPEGYLAIRAGVSRLTLREAVKRLSAQGVLQVVHGRGTYVRPTDEWSVLEPDVLRVFARQGSRGPEAMLKLLEARRLIETGAAELAAGHRTDVDIADLESTLGEMRTAEAAKDLEAFVQADIHFHGVVMRATQNELVAAVFRPIEGLVLEGRRTTARSPVARKHALAGHGAILEALRAASPSASREAMDAHLRVTIADHTRASRRQDALGRSVVDAGDGRERWRG